MSKSVLYLKKTKIDKNESAALKRAAIRDYFGRDIELTLTDKGKPLLENGYGFSVSHSGDLFALIITPCPVGLDIETLREGNFERVAKAFFGTDQCFFENWVRAESFSKLTGEGIIARRGKRIPENIIFTDITDKITEFFGVAAVGTVASERPVPPIEIKEIHI